jgi:hypothetical protein
VRKSIEEALKPMIASSDLSLTPVEYVRYLASHLDNVRIALSRAEEAEKTTISFVEATRPLIRMARDALLDIANSSNF